MDKKKVSDSIDGIIQDLINPAKTLEDCFRKTLILAYQLENEKLKTWAQNELNGYPSDESVPEYRLVGFEVKATIRQVMGGGILTDTINIPYQSVKHAYFDRLSDGYPLVTNIAGLQSVAITGASESHNALVFNLNPYVSYALHDVLQGWSLKSAWIQISDLVITEIISNIKNKLLLFLLDLNREAGNEIDYSIMKNSEKVDKLIEHTIGHIQAENITFNGNTYQTKGNQNNVVQGNQNSQQITSSDALIAGLKEFIIQVNKILEAATDLEFDSKEDITDQLQIISSQANREKPKLEVIGKSLQIIEGLLINIASTVYTPAALELLGKLNSYFQ